MIIALSPSSMDKALNRALADMRAHGCVVRESTTVIESAKDNSRWSGKKSNGKDSWELVKHKAESYNATF